MRYCAFETAGAAYRLVSLNKDRIVKPEEAPMIRKTANASRLQEEVRKRLDRLPAVVEEGVKISVPRPALLAEPDKTGCNWAMTHLGNAAGFERDIAAVLQAVQREYNLADAASDLASAANKPGNPFE